MKRLQLPDQGRTAGGKEKPATQPKRQHTPATRDGVCKLASGLTGKPLDGSDWKKKAAQKKHNELGTGQRRGRMDNADPPLGGLCSSGFVCLIKLPPPLNPGFVICIEVLLNFSWQETCGPTLKCLSYVNKPREEPWSTIKVKQQSLKMKTKTQEILSEELQ